MGSICLINCAFDLIFSLMDITAKDMKDSTKAAIATTITIRNITYCAFNLISYFAYESLPVLHDKGKPLHRPELGLVLTSIPIYAMNSVLLPSFICKHIDKYVRGFIWGDDTVSSMIHLVDLNTLC